jgi:hypothetical protein
VNLIGFADRGQSKAVFLRTELHPVPRCCRSSFDAAVFRSTDPFLETDFVWGLRRSKGGWRWSPSPQGERGQETTAVRVLCDRAPTRPRVSKRIFKARYILCPPLSGLYGL